MKKMRRKWLFFVLLITFLILSFLLKRYFFSLNGEISLDDKNPCTSSEFNNKLNIVNLPSSEGKLFHIYGNLITIGKENILKDLKGQMLTVEGYSPIALSTTLLHVQAELIRDYSWGRSTKNNVIKIIKSEEIPYTIVKGFVSKKSFFNGIPITLFFLNTFDGVKLIKLQLEGNGGIEAFLNNQTNKYIKIAGIVRGSNSSSNFFFNDHKSTPTFSVRYICTD